MWKKIVKFFKWAATYESNDNSKEKKEDDAIIATDLPLSDYENTIACIKVQPECKLDE